MRCCCQTLVTMPPCLRVPAHDELRWMQRMPCLLCSILFTAFVLGTQQGARQKLTETYRAPKQYILKAVDEKAH